MSKIKQVRSLLFGILAGMTFSLWSSAVLAVDKQITVKVKNHLNTYTVSCEQRGYSKRLFSMTQQPLVTGPTMTNDFYGDPFELAHRISGALVCSIDPVVGQESLIGPTVVVTGKSEHDVLVHTNTADRMCDTRERVLLVITAAEHVMSPRKTTKQIFSSVDIHCKQSVMQRRESPQRSPSPSSLLKSRSASPAQ